jgi:hypothetical protein
VPKPTPIYPAAIAGDGQLTIAVNRFQTTITQPIGSGDTQMTVADASQIVTNMLLSLDKDGEIVRVTGAPAGKVVPISRGFDGTTAVLHLSGATVSGMVDAWHHNALVAEVQAIQTTLGPNLSLIPVSPMVFSTQYDFPAQTPGGTLSSGNQVITLTPVPKGVNGTDTNHSLYISGGTGTAEAVPITGGTAVSGAASGTVIVTCANSHSGAWTIRSSTAGIIEAITDNPSQEIHIPAGSYTMHDTVKLNGTKSLILSGEGSSTAGTFLNFGSITDNRPAISITDPTDVGERKLLRYFNIQGTGTSSGGDGIYLDHGVRVTLDNLAVNSFARHGLHTSSAFEITVSNCQFSYSGMYGVLMDGVSNLNRLESCYIGNNSRLNGFGGISIVGPDPAAPTESILLDGVDVEGQGSAPFTTVTTTYGVFVQNVTGIVLCNSYIEGNVGGDAVLYQGGVTSIVEFNNWINSGHITYGATCNRITSFANTFYSAAAYRSILPSLATLVIGPDTCLSGSPECTNHPRLLGLGPATAQIAAATANLTLSTTATDVTGATITLNRSGSYIIRAIFDFTEIGAGDVSQLFTGTLIFDGVAQTATAVYVPGVVNGRACVSQQWLISTTTIGSIVKLQAQKNGGTGTSTANATTTTISASWVP